MASQYKQVSNSSAELHFSEALFGEVESSRMTAPPIHLTTFNAGDIVPVYCREVLPYEKLSINLEFVIRQTTVQTPTMGTMEVDFYAFFVPNRVVNKSFKAVMGENYNGAWTGAQVSLAPLVNSSTGTVAIPVGSIADYYGFPTQQALPRSVLSRCHDLKFRGYVMIYNEYFRDQNYQPPIPLSTLNVYQGFLDVTPSVGLGQNIGMLSIPPNQPGDGSFGAGAVVNELYGSAVAYDGNAINIPARDRTLNYFSALSKPLKANKLHDYFTSALPSPQKAPSSVLTPVSGAVNLPQQSVVTTANFDITLPSAPLRWRQSSTGSAVSAAGVLNVNIPDGQTLRTDSLPTGNDTLYPSNLVTPAQSLSVTGLSFDISDLRMAAAIQQVYEALGRGGSRYREYLRSFFGIDVDDPFDDIPKRLGHVRRTLDLYQTAQTSASEEGSTPQGNLSAFGYTANGGTLFKDVSFIEHGYVHVVAVVRHKNVYSSYMARDNFRLNMLDFYQPQLCNISEQPLYAYELNPFAANPMNAIGYQEAWAEYRYEPDQVSGYMRPGVTQSLDIWNYADEFDSGIQVINSDFLKSNSEEVLNRTLALDSSVAPQFKGAFKFIVDKTLPMPTYSVPGMDII